MLFYSMLVGNWLMIKYFHGEPYKHHCNNVERLAVVLVTCDPGVKRVRMLILHVLVPHATIIIAFIFFYL